MILRNEKNYALLFYAALLNGTGHRFSQVAILAAVYQHSESGAAIGLLMACLVVPAIIAAPLAGKLSTRTNSIKVLKIIDAVRAPVALLPLIATPDTLYIFFLATIALAFGSGLYQPLRTAAIPALVERKHIRHVNGMEQTMTGMTLVVGSVSAGVIALVFSTGILFILHALLLGAASFMLIRCKAVRSFNSHKWEQRKSLPIALFMKVALMRTLLIIMLLMPLANGVDNVIFNLFALEVYRAGDFGVGIMYGALGAGLMLSTLFAGMMRNKMIALGVIMIALEGVGHLLLSTSSFLTVGALTAIGITFAAGISNICFDTVMMKAFPEDKRGPLFAMLAMVQQASMGVAMITAGVLSELFTPAQLAAGVGVSYLLFSVLFAILFQTHSIKHSMRMLRRSF
ncbi:MFS transporter [Alkalicoccus luteus]|uniref:MFS transporter n=1 Tax=Alkalicoccus luteus TaxID=1237094 RepID=UPI0040332FFE